MHSLYLSRISVPLVSNTDTFYILLHSETIIIPNAGTYPSRETSNVTCNQSLYVFMVVDPSVSQQTTPINVIAEQDKFIFPCVKTLYDEPLVIQHAQGSRVVDSSGVTYLDMFAGILSTSLGHCHPAVNARVHAQIDQLGHTSSLYITENQIEAAKKLAQIAPGTLSTSMFLNSGSEAIDAAIRLARLYTGRNEIIALRHGYSGNSTLATHLTGHAAWRTGHTSLAGITHALAPYPYRSPFGDDPVVNADKFAQDIEDVILTTTSGRPAALIAETIQGVGGFIVPPPGYFQKAAAIIRKYGGVFICDEVQAGFGRTGHKWFGIEHWDIEPDIMVMAKGIANGYPVGALISRPEIAAAWTRKTISTFGGNPICMAATAATIDTMIQESVPSRAAVRGQQLRKGLEELGTQFDWIGQVRGMGLMQAIEIVKDRSTKEPDPGKTKQFLEAAKKHGVLVGIGGLHGQVIRIGPSLLISEQEIEEALIKLQKAASSIEN